MNFEEIKSLLGTDADNLLKHVCTGIPKEMIHLPGPDFIERVVEHSDRNNLVLNNMGRLFNQTGRLAGSGYLSVLPVDQ